MPKKVVKKKKPAKRPKKTKGAPENKMRKKQLSNKAGVWVRDPVRPAHMREEEE